MGLNFVITGIGGQGVLVAAELLAMAGLACGWGVKKSEVAGIAQRGGSVTSQVRWAARVYSPVISPGEADVLLAFERLEALRQAPWLRRSGVVLCNDYSLPPASVTAGQARLPTPEQERAAYAGREHQLLPALRLAQQELGDVRATNVVLLGALSALLDVPPEVWEQVIAARFAGAVCALNQRALALGRTLLSAETAARMRQALGARALQA